MDPNELVDIVESSWAVRGADLETRQLILLWVGQWLAKAAQMRGLPAMDDSIAMIGEPEDAFSKIRRILTP
jgi:hypothetical protein